MGQATEHFNPAPSLNVDLLDAIQLPPRRSIDPITFSPNLSLPSPSSGAPMGLFSQPMDLPSLQTYASISMNDFVVDGDFEKSPVATLPSCGQIGGSAGKSAWNPEDPLSNVLIRTPTDEVPGHHGHQMVPCTPGPASAEKGLVVPTCGPLDGAHFGEYQGSDDDCRDYFLQGGDKGTFERETFLFGSSDEDAVSGEIQLNLVTGQYVNVFDEGNSPAMIHSASKMLAKKNKVKSAKTKTTKVVPEATKKSARTAALRARKLRDNPSAMASGKRGDVADVMNVSSKALATRSSAKAASAVGSAIRSKTSPKCKAKATRVAFSERMGMADDADREVDLLLLSSQDLKTPISSQQSQGSQRSSGKKKPSRKTQAGRPVNTPITKKLGKADKKSIIRRASLPWIFGTVTCPRTGVEMREGGVPPAEFCTQCNATSTPVWRAGPFGHKTLCNACGVRWMKQLPSQRMK